MILSLRTPNLLWLARVRTVAHPGPRIQMGSRKADLTPLQIVAGLCKVGRRMPVEISDQLSSTLIRRLTKIARNKANPTPLLYLKNLPIWDEWEEDREGEYRGLECSAGGWLLTNSTLVRFINRVISQTEATATARVQDIEKSSSPSAECVRNLRIWGMGAEFQRAVINTGCGIIDAGITGKIQLRHGSLSPHPVR